MAAGVVEALEAVNVKHEEGHRLPSMPSDKRRKQGREKLPVWQPRQIVGVLNLNNAAVVIDKNARGDQNADKEGLEHKGDIVLNAL